MAASPTCGLSRTPRASGMRERENEGKTQSTRGRCSAFESEIKKTHQGRLLTIQPSLKGLAAC